MGKKVAVLGAGNGGYALASDLALCGFKVNLFELEKFQEYNLKPIEEKGGITRDGMRPGFAEMNMLTTKIEEALEDVQTVNVTIPAFVHEQFIEMMAPHLDGKTVVFFPLNFADIKLRNYLREKYPDVKTVIAGGETMPYACRRMERLAYIFVRWIFPQTRVASLPATDTDKLMKSIDGYPVNLIPVNSTLEVSMSYENPVGHIPMMLLNAASIERTKGHWEIFYDTLVGGETRVGKPQRSQEKLKKSIEQEQSVICEKLGFSFHAKPYEGKLQNPAVPWNLDLYWGMTDKLDYRYLTEDIPYGLVTWSSIGDMIGVPTPTMKACIRIASVLLERDFWEQGMTVEKLGLAGNDADILTDLFR